MNNAGAYREFYTLEGDKILGVKGGRVKEQNFRKKSEKRRTLNNSATKHFIDKYFENIS